MKLSLPPAPLRSLKLESSPIERSFAPTFAARAGLRRAEVASTASQAVAGDEIMVNEAVKVKLRKVVRELEGRSGGVCGGAGGTRD